MFIRLHVRELRTTATRHHLPNAIKYQFTPEMASYSLNLLTTFLAWLTCPDDMASTPGPSLFSHQPTGSSEIKAWQVKCTIDPLLSWKRKASSMLLSVSQALGRNMLQRNVDLSSSLGWTMKICWITMGSMYSRRKIWSLSIMHSVCWKRYRTIHRFN